MIPGIDTPHGPYAPQVPGPEDMARASELLSDTVEAIARVNHDVWAAKRIAEGWRFGPRRDDDARLHPDLVAYEHLPEAEKAYDRETARVVVAELIRRGLIRPG
ncbi:MAG: RyR domain-containing protein [Rhodocyclaceae bacterium]|nr:RyR domain-containing protein [Rhodocyclaceae bacterium]